MKHFWHRKMDGDSLILFCNGWGMDQYPFDFLESRQHDVCILSDYRDMAVPPEVEERFSLYRKRYLVSWSMGVWVGQQLFSTKKDQFTRRIAINGTLQPIDDDFGIPVSIYDNTRATFDGDGQQRFYRRMCRETGVLDSFKLVMPRRPISDQKEELTRLQTMVGNTGKQESIYTDVIVSDNDLVIPTAHQHAFWRGRAVTVTIKGCHFPFFRWRRWEDLLDLVLV